VDPVYAFLGLCSLAALHDQRGASALLALTAACLVKPQAVLLAPLAALVLWMDSDRTQLRRGLMACGLLVLAAFLPFVTTGHFLAALRGIAQVASLDYFSSNQLNVWWLANWISGAAAGGSLAGPVGIVRTSGAGFTLVRIIAGLPALGLTFLNLRWLWQELKQGNRRAIFWSAAVQVYLFTSVSLYPKENHLYGFFIYLLPVLFLGARRLTAIFAALSLVFFLNLFLFDGFGMGGERPGQALRMAAGFDLTVLVAAINAAFFVWLLTRPRWLFDETRLELK
jgi:hypothetical protein